MSAPQNPLVVVCRPHAQAQATLSLLRTAGFNCEALPLIDISAREPDPLTLSALTDRTVPVVAAIFVSQNAVAHGLSWITPLAALDTTLIAVGAGTKAALLNSGTLNAARVMAPSDDGDSEDSEGVLRLPALQNLLHRRVLLVRGESGESGESGEGGESVGDQAVVSSGRTLLADTLRARGAELIELLCYRRNKRALDSETRLRWQTCVRESTLTTWVIGSAETLDAWMAIFSDVPNAFKQHLRVPHERVAQRARDLGFTSVVVTSLAPAAILQSVTALPAHFS